MKQEPGMAARTTWPERSSSTQDQLCTAKRANGPDFGFAIPCVGCDSSPQRSNGDLA